MKSAFQWKLKDILMVAVIAVLFGVVFLACTWVRELPFALLAPFGLGRLGYEPFYGVYYMAGAFAIYVLRKPGTGVVAELLGGIAECLMGSYLGPVVILSGLVQGVGFELVIFLKHYRKFDRLTMVEASVVCALLSMAYAIFIRGYQIISIPILCLMLFVRIAGAVFFDGFVAPWLADSLVRAGLLRGYPVAMGDSWPPSCE